MTDASDDGVLVGANYLQADHIVSAWAEEYKRYLLDGDPRILHPKAKAALLVKLCDAFCEIERRAAEEQKIMAMKPSEGRPIARPRRSKAEREAV